MKKLLIFCLVFLPLVAWARKKAQAPVTAPLQVSLTADQRILFDSLYFEALSLNLQSKPGEALDWVIEALKVDSLSAPALYLRGKLYSAGRNPNGLRDVEMASQIDTTNYWYTSTLGELYLERGRFDLAIPCYERLTRQYPDKSDPYYHLAELYIRIDSLDHCLTMLDKIEELDGVNPNLTLQKFYILREQGKVEAAFDEYGKLIRRYPFDITYRLQLGDLQMKSGMIPAARQTYEDAAKIDPDNAYLWIAQSNYYSITGNQRAADSLVHNALLNVNLDIATKINILTEYLKTTLRKVALEKQSAKDTTDIDLPGVDSLFQTIAVMHPTASEVYDLHSDYLSAISRDSLAMIQMRFAVDLKPSEPKYWTKLLNYAAQASQLDEVLHLADEAKRLHPTLLDIYLTKAFVFARRSQNDSILTAYKEALAVIPLNESNTISRIYGYMGDVYHEIDDKAKCYECYDMALKYNDRNYTVLNNYAYFICLDGGDLNKAESMAAKVVQQYPDEPTYIDTYAWIYYLQGNYTLAKFYQQRAIDKAGENASSELLMHYNAILKALNE